MIEQQEIIFSFEKNLNNDKATYSKLIELYHILNALDQKKIILDFSNITFLSANLLAILGCCVDSTMTKRNHKIALRNLHPEIKAVMQKNGFNRYFTWNNLDDQYHNIMNYDIFKSTTEHLVDFERYLLLNVFSRNNLPVMNSAYKNSIIDNFLEMFNNVIDHANSSYVYVCGQFFPKSKNLCFSIVDIGKTIAENVTSYLRAASLSVPGNTLEWAIIPGNSTKALEAPGGLGFSTLLDFLKHNNGSFILISDKELYELQAGKERFDILTQPFPGAIVTITINLKDEQWYFFDKNNHDLIIF